MQSKSGLTILTGVLVLCGLYASSRYNYLLFHNLAELFSVLVAFLIFVLVWNTRHVLDNRYLLFIGIASLFSGVLDLVHTLAYKGMGVFPGYDANLATQFWIAFRALFSLSFLLAPFFIKRNINPEKTFTVYLLITSAVIAAIFLGRFPDCYIEGKGLTPFKIIVEYVISAVFLLALGLLFKNRTAFDGRVLRLVTISLLSSAASELSFTQYVSVFGFANMAGHFFELLAYYLIYKAIVVTGIVEPSRLLFRNLKLSEEKLRDSEERYRSLVELSPDAIAVHCEGKFVYINPAGVKLFGAADAGEIVGRDVLDLVLPDYRETVRERMQQSYEQQVSAPMREIKLLRIDGQPVDVETTSAPTTYGRKPATQVVIRDINDRKQAERKIEHLASFPKLNPNPVLEVDARGKITFRNEATASVLKRLQCGDDVSALLPGDMNEILKALAQESAAQVVYRAVEIQDETFAETIHLSKELNVARIYAINITRRKRAEAALRTANEELETRVQERTRELRMAVDSLREEVEERTRAENDLTTAKGKLQNTLESITDGFFTLDREWRFTHVNNETVREWRKSLEYLIGKSIWDVSLKTAGTIFEEQYRKAVREQVPVGFEAFSPLMERWVEARGYPDGEGLSVFFHDITERKETEQRTAVTNALLKLFAEKFDRKEYLDAACELIREWSGCRHVGLRIADVDGNIPYESCVGFNPAFLESERMLSVKRDHCACTRVIARKPERQDLPAMTRAGSFYLNNSMQFVEGLTEEQKTRFRGVCIRNGFTSIAVIPVLDRGDVLGAIHLADEREGMVPLRQVEFLEKMALIVGETVYRFGIEEELRRNYDALRESEARYRSLVEDVRDIIFTVKPDGAITSLSPAFESITGWPRDEWIGKHFSVLVHPADVPYALERFRRILSGKPLPLFELRGLTRSGEYRHFELKLSPGSHRGAISGIARDVTERKRAEEEHARLVLAVESVAEAVVITAPSTGVIQYVNPAFERITGYTKEEALGRTLHFLEGVKQDEGYYTGLRETLMRDGAWSGKLSNKKKDGALYFEECTVSPVRNLNGEIINYVYLKRDITEKLRLESIAEAVNTMNNIGYVFSGISHEIGNPVSSLMITLDLLKSKLDTSSKETISEYADRAMSQVSRIDYLLTSLKSFNLYETQDRQNVRMGAFMDSFLALVSEDFSNNGITISAVIEPDAEWGHTNARALQQVLLNVFTNAADALENRTNPTINLHVSRGTGTISIGVEDNGCGMTGEQQANLFKPFHTTKRHGTGLGMVIVKNMLTRMNGSIEIKSREGAGTSVSITIPEGDHGRQQP